MQNPNQQYPQQYSQVYPNPMSSFGQSSYQAMGQMNTMGQQNVNPYYQMNQTMGQYSQNNQMGMAMNQSMGQYPQSTAMNQTMNQYPQSTAMYGTMNQSMNQYPQTTPMNQTIGQYTHNTQMGMAMQQPMNQSINQSMNPSMNQMMNQSMNQFNQSTPMGVTINQSMGQYPQNTVMNQAANQYPQSTTIYGTMNQSMNQYPQTTPMNQSMNQMTPMYPNQVMGQYQAGYQPYFVYNPYYGQQNVQKIQYTIYGTKIDPTNQITQQMQSMKISSKPFVDYEWTPEAALKGECEKSSRELESRIHSWKRPREISKNPKLFVDGSEAGDVIQGALGDCYFLGALSVIALNENILKNLFIQSEPGKYSIRFYKNCEWKTITIDDRLPCNKSGKLVFARSKDPDEFWVPLIEKAYAKLHGSYPSIESGFFKDAMVDLTGGVGYSIYVEPGNSSNMELWNKISQANTIDILMGCSISSDKPNESEVENTGLVTGHAYGILKCCYVMGNKLICLRNPWGKKEWNGSWSDNCPKWKSVPEHIKKQIGFVSDNDGVFWMSYEDFCKYFTRVDVCRVFYTQWYTMTSIHGEWKIAHGTAGGNREPLKNPQFYFTVQSNQDAYLCISNMQEDARTEGDDKTKNICHGFYVFTAPDGPKKIEKNYIKRIYTQTPKWRWDREVVVEGLFKSGNYLLVPSAFDANVESKFYIRIFAVNGTTVTIRQL